MGINYVTGLQIDLKHRYDRFDIKFVTVERVRMNLCYEDCDMQP